ncbi:MAG: hypothetical protein WC279_08315 [Sulfurimonas sp.]|jgi:hypothetical protein|uniref:hypothetical protein n=1 Tax=Sulfurimonas sp. TaxID=2022749 RepID=UPI002A3AE319|nr:hypothetical protein [Sulfurimonas sp.]
METPLMLLNNKELVRSLDAETLKEIEESSTKDELIERLLEKIISPKKRLLTKEEILKMFSIPKQRFEHLVREGKMPHIFINNKIRLFNPDEVFDYLNTTCKIAS